MEQAQAAGMSAAKRQSIADRIATRGGKQATLNRHMRLSDNLIHGFLFFCGALSIFTTIGFTIVLGSQALRFFATTEWLNANKGLVEEVGAEDLVLTVPKTGSPITVGDEVRMGAFEENEVATITALEESEDSLILTVERGARGTEAVPHPANTPLYVGAEVTLAKFFTETKWAPQIGNFGILPLLSSTIRTSLIAMLFAVPLGLGAAVYLSEYASPRLRATLKPILEILAGIPTVVYGYFALTFVTPVLRQFLGTDTVEIYNVFSAGVVIGILIVPTIASISEDALRAVPNALREASYGLGATKMETVFKVLLPAALSGIAAAVILGVSRAVGETMVVLIAAGAGPNWTFNNFAAAETMAGHIARISTGDLSFGSIDYNSVFAVGLTLFVLTLILNFISTIVTRRFREAY